MKALKSRSIPLKNLVNKTVGVIAKYIITVPSEHRKAAFFGVLFSYTGALVLKSLEYSPDARLFPLLVGITLLGLILLKFVLMVSPEKYSAGGGGLFDKASAEIMSNEEDDINQLDNQNSVSPEIRLQREFKMTMWIIGTLLLTWLIGFLNASVIFIFSFIYVHEGKIVKAGGLTVILVGFIYFFFIEVLSIPLWEGILLSILPIAKPANSGDIDD